MGSVPSDYVIKEQQQEAYAAILRAIYAHPHLAEPLETDQFLTQSRKMLNITNSAAILESVRPDLELIRQGQIVRAGSGTPLAGPGPIGAPGGARSGGGGAKSRSAFKTPGASKGRSRAANTRSTGSIDPEGLVGRRVWRYYPNEDEKHPWVEGFFTGYDRSMNTYTITYDPNKESMSTETGFSLELANPAEYVLGDYAIVENQMGSRRWTEKPAPVHVQSPAGHPNRPSKRSRRDLKIPAQAPFAPLWFEDALASGSAGVLQIMLTMLEMRERDIVDTLQWAQLSLEMGQELETRLKLEAEFHRLVARENEIHGQLTALRKADGVTAGG